MLLMIVAVKESVRCIFLHTQIQYDIQKQGITEIITRSQKPKVSTEVELYLYCVSESIHTSLTTRVYPCNIHYKLFIVISSRYTKVGADTVL